jgi:hypothetical protein
MVRLLVYCGFRRPTPEESRGLKSKPPGASGQAANSVTTMFPGKAPPKAGRTAIMSVYRVERRLAVISPYP